MSAQMPELETVEEEARRFAKEIGEDAAAARKWMRKQLKTHYRCTQCVDGIDAEPDGFGGAVGGTCMMCAGSGWLPQLAIAKATAPTKAEGST